MKELSGITFTTVTCFIQDQNKVTDPVYYAWNERVVSKFGKRKDYFTVCNLLLRKLDAIGHLLYSVIVNLPEFPYLGPFSSGLNYTA